MTDRYSKWLPDGSFIEIIRLPANLESDQPTKGGTMGHPYRERHETPASTTTDNLTGLGAPPTTGNASWTDRLETLTKEDLQAELEKRGLPKTGNKDELAALLDANDKANQ